jgi:hypothetical protein
MTRKEFWIPLAVVALGAAFALVSWLVWASRGHPWLIRRKLRLGALLLGLTWSASGCDSQDWVTCYEPALPDQPDMVSFDAQFRQGSGLRLDLDTGRKLHGQMENRSAEHYSFQLVADDASELARGELVADDGSFDTATEAFSLLLSGRILPAQAILRLYRQSAGDISPEGLIFESGLAISDGP